MNPFLRNAWYVAAWDDEVSDQLMSRQLLNERILLYRSESGDPIALGNECPHRFAPLHMGKRFGDVVECGYHGLRFDRTGSCVFNPHGTGVIPTAARVKSYAVEERHGAIWIWMGNPALATSASIPDFSHLTDPGYRTLRGNIMVQAAYDLMVDNLMDASHGQFVHNDLAGTTAFNRMKPELTQVGSTVHVKISLPAGNVPRSFAEYLDPSIQIVDTWVEFQWDAPCMLQNRTGLAPAGEDRAKGAEKRGSHLITPETETTSHYFFAHSRSFKQEDRAVDDAIRNWQRVAFSEQDSPMIEACQKIIGNRSINDLKPVMLSSDIGVVRWRRVFSELLKQEQSALAGEQGKPLTSTPEAARANTAPGSHSRPGEGAG